MIDIYGIPYLISYQKFETQTCDQSPIFEFCNTNRAEPPMMSQHLPEEVVYDILTRLTVKSIFRFRCVSKSWNSIFTNPIFITAHFNFNQAKSLSNNSHNGFLLYTHKISYNIKELRTVFYKVLKEKKKLICN